MIAICLLGLALVVEGVGVIIVLDRIADALELKNRRERQQGRNVE